MPAIIYTLSNVCELIGRQQIMHCQMCANGKAINWTHTIRGTKIALIDRDMHELWAPENEGLVLLQHKVCTLVVMCQVNTNTAIHIFLLMNTWIWKIWIITTRQLRVHVTLFFPYFSDQYLIKTSSYRATHFTSYWNANLVLEQNSSFVFRHS